ncbi:MAG: cupin domain-containing protein [Gemmatimonadales bacterium]
MRFASFTTGLLLLISADLAAQVAVADSELQWGSAPALFPSGAQIALISGDPIQPGRFVARLRMPDGYRMAPHYHPADEHVEVNQGTLLVGVGDKLDLKKVVALGVGDTATTPAGAHHYSVAKGVTVVTISAAGPYVMNYLDTRQEPWRPFPYGY